MDISKCVALAFVLLICVMPVKRGNMLKSKVTPAPPVDLSELIGRKEETKYEQPVVVVTAKEEVESDISEQTNIVSTEVVQVVGENNKSVPPEKNIGRQKRRQIKYPVCQYNIAEIFKFGNLQSPAAQTDFISGDITLGPSVEKSNVTIEPEKDEESKTKDELGADKNETSKLDKEEENMKLEVDSMQSFEEWKNLKLQEQESHWVEGEPAIHVPTVRTKKTQVNYASQDCGAKVLANNKEAKHVSAILDENRDMYMLNPCSTNIWFVIELCEPVQVQQLQLGNLELFSSAPREFVVSVSERYPAREWRTLGTFYATNDRNLQTFVPNTEGNNIFAKYIKFEMLSHFSNEHFCPLTLVRVLGVSMVDELDASENPSTKDDETQAEQLTGTEEDTKNSGGPINAVLNMVKTAVDHVLNNGADSVKDSLTDTKVNKSLENNDTEVIDPTVESEVVLVTNDTEIANSNKSANNDFITLVETGHGEDISEYLKNLTATCSPKKIPLYMPKFINFIKPISQKFNANMCWILEFFCKVSLAGCLVHYPYNYSQIGLFVSMSTFKNESLLITSKNNTDEVAKIPDNITQPVIINNGQNDVVKNTLTSSVDTHKGSEDQYENKEEILKQQDDDEKGKTNVVIFEDDKVTAKTREDVDPPIAESENPKIIGGTGTSATGSTASQNELNKVDDNQDSSTVEDSVKSEEDKVFVDTAKNYHHEEDNNDAGSESDTVDNETMHQKNESLQNDQSGDQAEEPVLDSLKQKVSKPDSNTALQDVQTPHQHPIVTAQKDSVFMRLSNRIRALERNLSLSSDYLETLSQRYKKQMDEMQRAFNQTTSKLLSTSRTAKENDARQTELIQRAQAEIEMLTHQLQNLSLTHDQLNMQLVERHMCLIILEVLVFFAVLVTCLGRRMTQMRNDVQRAEIMIEELQNLLSEVQSNSKSAKVHTNRTLNGHCASIPFQNYDSNPPPDNDPICHMKKQKAKHRMLVDPHKKFQCIKHAGVIDANKGDQKVLSFTSNGVTVGVENIGDKSEWPGVKKQPRAKTKSQNWNGHPIALKIPNGHAKGRK